jgi:hypothetical protein
MAHPIVFVSHFTIKAGKLDALKQLVPEVSARLEAEKPRTAVFLTFLDGEGTQATFVHLFADADAMDLHFEGSDERSRAALEFVDPNGWEIYGRPSDDAVATMNRLAMSAGVPLTIHPEFLAGFARVSP